MRLRGRSDGFRFADAGVAGSGVADRRLVRVVDFNAAILSHHQSLLAVYKMSERPSAGHPCWKRDTS